MNNLKNTLNAAEICGKLSCSSCLVRAAHCGYIATSQTEKDLVFHIVTHSSTDEPQALYVWQLQRMDTDK